MTIFVDKSPRALRALRLIATKQIQVSRLNSWQ